MDTTSAQVELQRDWKKLNPPPLWLNKLSYKNIDDINIIQKLQYTVKSIFACRLLQMWESSHCHRHFSFIFCHFLKYFDPVSLFVSLTRFENKTSGSGQAGRSWEVGWSGATKSSRLTDQFSSDPFVHILFLLLLPLRPRQESVHRSRPKDPESYKSHSGTGVPQFLYIVVSSHSSSTSPEDQDKHVEWTLC